MDETNNIEKVKQEMQTSRMIFSEKEVDDTVKSFVLAYLHGKVTITFPTDVEIKGNMKKYGKPLTTNGAFVETVKLRADLLYFLT